jgi:hypothetical protein
MSVARLFPRSMSATQVVCVAGAYLSAKAFSTFSVMSIRGLR